MTLEERIRIELRCYDQDAAGQIDHLTGSIRAVLDWCALMDRESQSSARFATAIRSIIASRLGITQEADGG